jgi:hypothetical protein
MWSYVLTFTTTASRITKTAKADRHFVVQIPQNSQKSNTQIARKIGQWARGSVAIPAANKIDRWRQMDQ